jgi:hypothetical protein
VSAPPHAGTYADAYNTYLASGLGGPLPLRPGTKWPPPTGWTGWDGDYPSAADCAEWATEHHDYRDTTQLGLRLASTVIAIDVDAYDGKRGADTMREALLRWGALPPGPWSTAREDGRSAIRPFRVPDGAVLAGKLALTLPSGEEVSDVEIIQAHHRYMLCAPSIHPKTGARYRWYNTAGPDTPPNLADLPELPQGWIDALSRAAYEAENVEPGQVRDFVSALPVGPPCPPMQHTADAAVLAVRDAGSRHDTMRDNVLRVLRLGEQGHTGAPAALERMRDALVSERTADGTGTRASANGEFDRMVYGNRGVGLILTSPTSVMDKGCCPTPAEPAVEATAPDSGGPRTTQDHQQTAPDLAQPQDHPAPGADPDYAAAIELEAIKLRIRRAAKRLVDAEELGESEPPSSISLADLLDQEDEEQAWRINELWPRNGKVLFVGPKKAGKTTATGNLVRSLCDSQPFLGAPEGRPGPEGYGVSKVDRRIVLFDFEMTPQQLKRWLRLHGIRNQDRLHVKFMRGKTWDIRDRRVRREWAAYLHDLDIGTIIADPLASATAPLGINENDNSEMGAFLHALDALTLEAGADELLVSHHAGKGAEDGRGASVLEGWPDAIWRLTVEGADQPGRKLDPEAARFFAAQGRDVSVRETKLEFDAPTKRLWLGVGNRTTYAVDKNAGPVVELIRDQPGVNRNRIKDAVSMGTDTLGAVLQALKAQDVVHFHEGPNRSHLYYPGKCTTGCRGDR